MKAPSGIKQYHETNPVRIAEIMAAGPWAIIELTVATRPFQRPEAMKYDARQQNVSINIPATQGIIFSNLFFISSSKI